MITQRLRVAAAARELLLAGGPEAVTLEAAALRAGVPEGSYVTRQELLIAALEEHWAALRPHFEAAFEKSIPPLDRLKRFLEGALVWQDLQVKATGSVVGCLLLRAGSVAGAEGAAVRRAVSGILGRMARTVEGAIRDAQSAGLLRPGDAAVMARTVLEYLEGVLALARIDDDLTALRSAVSRTFEFLGVAQAQ